MELNDPAEGPTFRRVTYNLIFAGSQTVDCKDALLVGSHDADRLAVGVTYCDVDVGDWRALSIGHLADNLGA
jgi:hypothetical protein